MINKILKKIDQVPLLPQNIQQLMAIVNNPQASTAELVKIVEQDPALVMQSLHLCNSAYYSLPVQVTSVTHAVRFLGMDTVAGLAMAAYFQSLLPSRSNRPEGHWLKGLKDHLLMTAQLSETLAKAAGSRVAPATLFTAGLLHDVGKLVFSKLDPKVGQDVYHHATANNLPLIMAEQEIMGTDHAAVGWQMAIRWRLPDVLMDAIRYHHDPFSSEYTHTLYVFMANKIANVAYDERLLEPLLNTAEMIPVSEEMGLSAEQMMALLNTWAARQGKEV
jgi:putative nucleotidyltransferase with HDIG domain